MSASQLPLKFEPRVNWDEADFLVADCNRQAVQLVKAWPDWPSHAAIIFGPPGSGKSHLARIWQSRSTARVLNAEGLAIDAASEGAGSLIVENVDRGGIDERALFHLLNHSKERKYSVLLTGQTPPGQWSVLLPDLRSRVRCYPAVAIKEPDDELLAAVLIKHFADRQLSVAPDVIPFILSRMERSMQSAQVLTAQIDQLALSQHRKITRALAARAIKDHPCNEPECDS